MTTAEFIEELEIALNEETGSISEGSVLTNIIGYDSMGMLVVIAMLDKLGASVNVDKLRECDTVGNLIALVELK